MSTSHGHQPADRSDVRATNLVVVLRHATAHAPCSRADIAAATGLTKATVSSLVGDLIQRRLLRETGLTVHRVGRPATMIERDGSAYASIGLEVGPGRFTLVALDPTGRRLLSWRRVAPPAEPTAPGRTLAGAAALARRAVGRLRGDGRQLLGLTVGVPGEVDGDGTVLRSEELGWYDVAARDQLQSALGAPDFPVSVEAGTLLAAKAEHRYGGHAGTADLVCLGGTHRVLAGIITGGAVLRGAQAAAGRIGHLPAGSPEPVTACDCGRVDCLNAVATVAALARRVDPDDPLTDLDGSVEDVARRANAGDPAVIDALGEVGRRLGAGLSPVVDLLDPSVVVLGGHYARIAPWVAPPAGAELRRRSAVARGEVLLAASTLGHEAVAIGGATGALDDLNAGHLPPAHPSTSMY